MRNARGYTYKAGIVVKTTHDLPHMVRLREAAVETAPELYSPYLVVFTEAWRPERHPNDAHNWCLAFDIRIHNIVAESRDQRIRFGHAWIERMRVNLNDPRYQFELHGEGDNVHIHAEFDPRN